MKKILFAFLILAKVLFAYSQPITDTIRIGDFNAIKVNEISQTKLEITYSYDTLYIAEDAGYYNLYVQGTYPSGKIGTPSLPISRNFIAVPETAIPVVRIKNYSYSEIDLSQGGISSKLYPQQPSLRKDKAKADIVFDKKVYAKDEFILNQISNFSILGKMRGVNVGLLEVSPIDYNPQTNVLRIYNDIEVEILFENADMPLTMKNIQMSYSPYFNLAYKNFLNRSVFDDHQDLYHTPVKMLVVAHDMFADNLQEWLTWKIQKGFDVDLHYVSEIGTTAESIKNFISGKYTEGLNAGNAPTFVILVGDVAQVPPSAEGSQSQEATDLYYASIDGDYFPEMYCSRMSAESLEDLSNITEKILMYEKYEMPDPSYLDNVLLIAGSDATWNPRIGQPTINYATQNYFNTEHGFDHVYAYLDSYTGCYDNLSTGVGFANYTAHGGEQSWAGPEFNASGISALTNADKYFFAVGNCCVSGKFGYSLPCFGELLIRASKKGAFTYIGSCPNTYWYEDYYWSVGATSVESETPTLENSGIGAYDLMFEDSKFNTISSVMYAGNLSVTGAANGNDENTVEYYWQAYHVLGDGSVMPYFTNPSENQVSHSDRIVIGVESFQVTAEPGSYVSITKDNVILGVAVVGQSGIVSVPISGLNAIGECMVVVTRQQYQPYIANIMAISPDGSYLTVSGYSPRKIRYGETAPISIEITNLGTIATLSESSVLLHISDEYVTVNDSVAQCEPLAADMAATDISNAFSITVSQNAPDEYSIPFSITIENGGEFWITNGFIQVQRPVLECLSYSAGSQILPGSEFPLSIETRNSGSILCSSVIAVLSSDNDVVQINNDMLNLGNINPEESVISNFEIEISPLADWGEELNFRINYIGDAGNITSSLDFTLIVDPCGNYISEFPYTENFASNEMPQCWTQEFMQGESLWSIVSADEYSQYVPSIDNNNFAYIANFAYSTNETKLISPKFDFSGISSAELSFYHTQKAWSPDQDMLRIYYRNSEGGSWILLKTYTMDVANWQKKFVTLPNLSEEYQIAFSGTVKYGYGIGLDSVMVVASTCSVPELSVSFVSENTANLSWNAVADSFDVYKNDLLIATTTENLYIDDNADVSDCYKVISHCENYTETSNVVCLSTLSIAELENFMLIYPNPASSRIMVELEGLKKLYISDALGRIVVELMPNANTCTINVENLSSGLYFIKAETKDSKIYIQKITITN